MAGKPSRTGYGHAVRGDHVRLLPSLERWEVDPRRPLVAIGSQIVIPRLVCINRPHRQHPRYSNMVDNAALLYPIFAGVTVEEEHFQPPILATVLPDKDVNLGFTVKTCDLQRIVVAILEVGAGIADTVEEVEDGWSQSSRTNVQVVVVARSTELVIPLQNYVCAKRRA